MRRALSLAACALLLSSPVTADDRDPTTPSYQTFQVKTERWLDGIDDNWRRVRNGGGFPTFLVNTMRSTTAYLTWSMDILPDRCYAGDAYRMGRWAYRFSGPLSAAAGAYRRGDTPAFIDHMATALDIQDRAALWWSREGRSPCGPATLAPA